MKKIVLIIMCIFAWLSGISALLSNSGSGSLLFAQNISTPNHEASIIMIEIQNNQLYTLDYNGLLLKKDLRNGQTTHTVPIKKHIINTFFHFPYIVMVDIDNMMYIYDIEKRFISYSAPFLDNSTGGYASFSDDNAILAYTGNEQVHIINTKSWNTISTHSYKSSLPIFLFISNNKQNLMSYHSNGNIVYRSIANGNILKSVSSEIVLETLILNNTLRFGIGHTNKSLISIDLVSGKISDSILFTNPIIDIYISERTDDATNITVVSNESGNTEKTMLFSLLDSGSIQEKDLFSIDIPKPTSTIMSNNTSIYVGFVDGEVWAYEKNKQSSPKTIISSDYTLAIYDAIYYDNTLLMSTVEGVLSINLDNETLEVSTAPPMLINQPLQNPSFIINQSSASNKKTAVALPSLHVLSSVTPYSHLIPPLQNTTAGKNADINTIDERDISLLFSFVPSPQSIQTPALQQLVRPDSFANNIHILQTFDTLSIAYSAFHSQLYIRKKNMSDITIPILSPHIYFQYYKNILWTTTPLLNTEVNLENNSNILYSYTIDDTLQSAYTPIALSFIQGSIHNFQVIDDNAFLITSTDTNTSTFFYIETQNKKEDHILYPQYIQMLFQINNDTLQKIIPISSQKTESTTKTSKFLVVTKKHLHIVSINTEEKKLHFVHTIRIPDTLGIIINANIQIIPTQSSSPEKHLITIVDKNNVVSLFELDDKTSIEYNTSIIIQNDYTLSQY